MSIMQEKSFETQAAMIFLAVLLTLVTIVGNGAFLAILARFKALQNFTNILLASLAVADSLNALLNIPIFIIYFVVAADWLEGKAWAIIASSLQMEFILLNLVSMTALMLDRFLAVSRGLWYFNWKTTTKAKTAVFLIWLGCTIVVMLAAIPVFYMDLDGVPITQSRSSIFQERRVVMAILIALFTLASTVLGLLTCYSIHQNKKERKQLNLPPLAAEARLQKDIKATYTVLMATAMYYICYVPTVALSIWRRNENQRVSSPWLVFMIAFCYFLSSAFNPIIYVIRSTRNRSAIRQFLKDPCGRSPFRENPIRKGNKAKQPEMKPPQIRGEELKNCRDPAANPNTVGDTRQPEAGPDPGSDAQRAISATVQIHQPKGKECRDPEAGLGTARDTRRPISATVQILQPSEEESKEYRDLEAVSGTGSDTRGAISATIQFHQSHSVVKRAWEKKEENSSSQPADEQVAFAGESSRSSEKAQDKEDESSGSVRDKGKKRKAAGRKRIGTSHGVKVRPYSP